MKVCSVCRRCYEDSVFSCSEENHGQLATARVETREPVNNYLLETLLESSATGETFRAVNTILNKPYLIKIIAPKYFDETQKKQFLKETQSLSAIIHSNITRVFESGTLDDGSLYVVTEFIAAQTLRDCLENVGAPSEVTALTITRQAAEGLEAIHAVGVLHRNIRPENIILTTDAENRFLVKLQNPDFGGIRQKNANANPELNLSDFRYFSPEQCAAEQTDAQTDVYGLGIVLYEILAGKVPFDAPYADAIIAKQLNETPPPVKINSFDLRMLLTHTLSDALQKTMRLRLKSANAFARRIRHIEQLATHSPTPPPAMSYPSKMDKSAIIFAPPVKVETAAVIEEKNIDENPIAEPVQIETETFSQAETILEASPANDEELFPLETVSAIENQAESFIETETQNETLSVAAVENCNPTEIKDSYTEIEDSYEDNFPVENLPPTELSAPVEVTAENSDQSAPLVAGFPDLTTTKLPPLETIIENSSAEEAPKYETSKLLKPQTEEPQIHQTIEPVLIEWEQPDDMPTVTQALGKSRKEIADAQFAAQKETIIDIGEADAPPSSDSVIEPEKTNRNYADEPTLFAYTGAGKTWNLPEKRKILTVVGILTLIVLAIGGTLLSRQALSASDERRTAAQSSPNGKNQTQIAEPVKVAQNDQPITPKNVDLSVSNPSAESPEADIPAIPEYQPREIEPKSVAPKRVKKQILKDNPELRESVAENKTETNTVFDKKGNERSVTDRKSSKNQSSNSSKSEVFTRPRIVKNPKN